MLETPKHRGQEVVYLLPAVIASWSRSTSPEVGIVYGDHSFVFQIYISFVKLHETFSVLKSALPMPLAALAS